MANIYVGQDALQIKLTCGQDITSALTLGVGYRKPDGTIGRWTAAEHTAATGIITYDLTASTELDQAGVWRFWAYVEFSDGREATGDVIEQTITTVGDVA